MHLSILGNAKCSYMVVLEENPRAHRGGTCKHWFHTALLVVTGPLRLILLAWREITNWIVLQVKRTKPIVKLVTRVLLASK